MAPEEKNEQASSPEMPPPPHSWPMLAVGGAALVVAAVVCVVLFYYLQIARPVDMRSTTRALSDIVRDQLIDCRVPALNIRAGEDQDRRDPHALWTFREMRVTVPPELNVMGLSDVLRKKMAERQVSTTEITPGTAQTAMQLSLGEHAFAHLYFEVAAPIPAQTVGTSDCEGAKIAVLRLAADLGLQTTEDIQAGGMPRLVIRAVTEQQRWEMAGRLAGKLAGAGFTIAWGAAEAGVSLLTVGRDGTPCIELTVASEEGEAIPEQPLRLESMMVDHPDEAFSSPLKPQTPPAGRPRVAIIVDDGGYGGPTTDAFLAMPSALTLAILPNTPHGAETAERAKAAGFEIMLHMPMENSDGGTPFPGQIDAAMPPEEIQELTRKALAQVPHAVGVNNHTGSKFTADAAAMAAFLDVVEESSLYFVDSRTTPDSVALDVARERGIPSLSREVFLDHEGNGEFVRKQFARLVELATTQGTALGICHFRSNTVKTLTELLPTLDAQGIDLVHVSEILP